MVKNHAPLHEMTLLSMSLMSSKDAVLGIALPGWIEGQISAYCDPGTIFVTLPLSYFTHHLCVDNLFTLVVRDVQVPDKVDCVGSCNSFAAGFVTRTDALAELPEFIGV